MTLITSISAGFFRPAPPLWSAPAVQPLAVRPSGLFQDPPLPIGITLDNIPFIGDAAILTDDLPLPPSSDDTLPARSLANSAARSYLEAKTFAGETAGSSTDTAQLTNDEQDD